MANATRVSDVGRGYFIGTYSGTTAAQNIHIGFKPSLLLIVNVTDGDKIALWANVAGYAAKITTIDTEVANECITIAQVDDGTTLGFSLTACTTAVNENSKVFLVVAWP